MLTLGTHFDELLKNIQPPQERQNAAQTLPRLVRDYLERNEDFPTVSPHSRLVGSYAQHLSVGDVKDVDFVVFIDGNPEDNEPEAKQLIKDLKKALDGLPAAIGYEGWTGIDIKRARRSVHVHFEGKDFHLDVVPCIAPDGVDERLFVPDRGFNKWIASHPLGYIDLLNDLNTANGRKVRSLGKLLKHFRDYHMKNRRPKSYWLGALLVHHVQRDNGLDMKQPLAILFRDLLDMIYKQYASLLGRTDDATPNIKDPMLGHNISWNWSRPHFETFMKRLDEGREWATKALQAEDREVAIGWWQKIFGEEYFPTDITEVAQKAAASGLPGQSFVTASGLILSNRPESGVYTDIRQTTFHGE